MQKYFYILFFTFLSLNAVAASLSGTITDAKNDPLTGVVISITGSSKGTVTDFDGKFEIKGLENGTYEVVFTYATYKTYKQNIVITGNQDAILDMKMYPETNELKEGEVKAVRITNTENSVISEIKSSNTIVSGTSAAQISKTLDRNAADVAKRIPGVTIQDDRFIVIRGLPDRYNTVWMNDASTPSSEADKKSFSFDIIPAGLIDRLLIYKAPSPELPGDFAGGMVKVYSTCLTDKNQVIVSLSGSSREYTTGTDFNYNKQSSTDWLGYDDGSRNVPKGVPENIKSSDPNYKANIATWSKAFGNDWIVQSKKASPDARFSAAMSHVWKFKKLKIGTTAGVVYANTYNNTRYHRQDFDSVAQKYNYSDLRSANTVNAGFMANAGVSIGNTKIEFRNLYSQIGTSSMTYRSTIRDTGLNPTHPDDRAYSMGYDSKATYASELSGTHKNKTDTRKYNWTLGYTDLFKNQPDLRRIKYTRQWTGTDTIFNAQLSNQVDILNGGGRYYSSLYEHTYSFNHIFTQNIKIADNFNFDVNVGNYLEYKERSYKIRELGYTGNKSSATVKALLKLPINSIFADSNVDGSKKFKMGENTQPYDHYDAQNELIASFINLRVPVGKRLTVCGGVRYEQNMQSLKAVRNATDTFTSDVTTKFLLPSFNASYNFNEKSLVRAAYGKTLNRPEFREWSTLFYYDFDELAGTYGAMFPTEYSKNGPTKGDTIKTAEIHNIDVRYELYPTMGEMISVGAFYKSFKNPIMRAVLNGGDSKSYTFINADDGYCAGLEVDVRKNLSQLDTLLGTKLFSNFTFVGNLTLTKSQINIDTARKGMGSLIPKSNLQGQSPYILNLGVYYQSQELGLQGSLLYNVFGTRMYAIGQTVSGAESVGEMPVQTFDFTVSKLFFKHYILTLGVQNMLDSRVVFKLDANRDGKFDPKDDREYKSYNMGRYYSIGIKVKF